MRQSPLPPGQQFIQSFFPRCELFTYPECFRSRDVQGAYKELGGFQNPAGVPFDYALEPASDEPCVGL